MDCVVIYSQIDDNIHTSPGNQVKDKKQLVKSMCSMIRQPS